MGSHFLMLTHVGRRTGKVRHTVLEVLRHDAATGEYFVVSAYGETSDWYRNLRAKPALHVHVGGHRFAPVQRFLAPDEAYQEFLRYERRNPRLFRSLLKLIGLEYDGSEAQRRALVSQLPMVAFRPTDEG
jgi:deazaflavin-dependent oxidoreductase (nitroreductase family)